MAQVNVVMPKMGESITSGTITKWHKKPGDAIEIDDPLFEISTEKVSSEIPAITSGRMEEVLYSEGDNVDVGITICIIEDEPESNPFNGGKKAAPKKESSSSEAASSTPKANSTPKREESGGGHRKNYTPLVKVMAQKAGISLSELDKMEGTGVKGRVTKSDLEQYINQKGGGSSTSSTTSSGMTPSSAPSTGSSYSAPATGIASLGNDEIIPMDNMRKAIAKNMVTSKLTSPHVNSASEIDMTHLVKYRESIKDDFQRREGFKITYTPFIMRAIILALKDFPKVNASVDGDNIVVHKDINLGCAVAVPGDGLVVPVVKHADSLSMIGLCRAVNDLANKARSKKLTMDELSGGTYTFTNVGSFGTMFATPVILQPQVGIYAAGAIQKRPVVVEGDAIAVRSMMYGVHTYDHRLIDGEMGGKFLERVHGHLREMNPKNLF